MSESTAIRSTYRCITGNTNDARKIKGFIRKFGFRWNNIIGIPFNLFLFSHITIIFIVNVN